MKYLITILCFALAFASCESGKTSMKRDSEPSVSQSDTIRIANKELEYEIIIIEPGFNAWLVTQEPKGFYGQNYLEGRNMLFVTEYNRRVRNFQSYSTTLYPMEINYEFHVDYGLEVNYLLYNYFKYFQQKYEQRLTASTR